MILPPVTPPSYQLEKPEPSRQTVAAPRPRVRSGNVPSLRASAARLPAVDQRLSAPARTLDTPRSFPEIGTLAEWRARRMRIRRQILVSCGLYPLPPRTRLNAHIFDRVIRDGYSIEKVYFESFPGFYVTGNLYSPGPPRGEKVPAVLVAHGHWPQGRMADTTDGSIPARAITFARQGYVAFTYDMVGYNDSRQVSHSFAGDRRHWLHGISLMGLQLWDSLRAVDFLESLGPVDRHRIAVTGESGGGTQTFMLGAVDDRLAAQAPCVMVSHTMQGGCLCENAPGLRVDESNMEIAAAAATRPQILVAATGDWTASTMTIEGPAVQSIYRLYGHPDRLSFSIYDYGHNINKTSREAVYAFFGRWLLHDSDASHFHEPPYQMEPVANLRVFPDGKPLPPKSLDAEGLVAHWNNLSERQLRDAWPHDDRSLRQFQKVYRPAWECTLAVGVPRPRELAIEAESNGTSDGYRVRRLVIGRAGRGDRIPALLFEPPGSHRGVVLAAPAGIDGVAPGGRPGRLASALLCQGFRVLAIDAFGVSASTPSRPVPDLWDNYYTTYNRTPFQERVQDLITAAAYLRRGGQRAAIVGLGKLGPAALAAAPAADGAAADLIALGEGDDGPLLGDDLFVPGLRRMGDFRTAAALAAPHPLFLRNACDGVSPGQLQRLYSSLGHPEAISIHPGQVDDAGPMDDAALARWLSLRMP